MLPRRCWSPQNPGVFDAQPGAAEGERQSSSPTGGYLRDADGVVGRQTLERWQGYSGFLYDQGLLTDARRQAADGPPDYAALFTNDFLP